MQRFKITKEGYNKLKAELDNLVNVERPKVSQAIGEAIELGDLSENAEYHYSKDRQRIVEGMIANLTEKLSCADIVDITKLSGDISGFGATVLVFDEDTEREISYKTLLTKAAKTGKMTLVPQGAILKVQTPEITV